LGHLLACFSDTFTKQGVQLFFPSPVWCVCGSNPNRRLTTGSPSEYWVLAGAIALLLINSHLIVSGGGIVQTASQQLGLRDGLIEIYNQKASSHHVWANIEGVRAGDRSPVSGRFLILGTEGNEFIVTDGKGVYKTGEQIIANKVNTDVGRSAGTRIKTLTFRDEEAIAPLTELGNSIDGVVYLTGSLTVDFPEEIELPTLTDEYERVSLSGSVLKLKYQPIDEAIALLKEQFAVGTLTAKIIQPSPEFKR
jgi:inner membrane protein